MSLTPPTAAKACAILASRAYSAAATITALPAPSPALAFVATRLQQFGQHAEQLGDCLLNNAAAVSPALLAAVEQALPECDSAVGAISVRAVDGTGDVSAFSDVLAACSRMMIFAAQISTVGLGEEQETWLQHEEGRQLFSTVEGVSKQLLSPSGVSVPN
ncbi:hypothetical protein B0T25DRAFT_636017 [Lasiosphaeria hispida]|uniref:Uncharacterized protein n=1 Tax=Lasiosphaeria hispida TaxID=260671 RepID=A0AAJ0M8U7_9PEZI|nr:hypothetical protein B0T25DRAFT_636017 [Lasiosphaeria hispida]